MALKDDIRDALESADKEKKGKRLNKKKLKYLLATVGLSVLFCVFYYTVMEISARNPSLYYFFPTVMFIYMALLAVLALVYIIYNRGFSRKGVTVDMLPLEWSDEKKQSFVESGKQRLERSKWLLVFIIALLFTFVMEAVVLFALPTVKEFFA
ncbi:MAG: hypothetical protein IIX30_04580 [Clostridia bacterium]|nr:hypothetical protein [Clostridia bacterium]